MKRAISFGLLTLLTAVSFSGCATSPGDSGGIGQGQSSPNQSNIQSNIMQAALDEYQTRVAVNGNSGGTIPSVSEAQSGLTRKMAEVEPSATVQASVVDPTGQAARNGDRGFIAVWGAPGWGAVGGVIGGPYLRGYAGYVAGPCGNAFAYGYYNAYTGVYHAGVWNGYLGGWAWRY